MPAKKKQKLQGPMESCRSALTFISSKPEVEAFLEPVDWEAYELYDYPKVIKHPMDLGTVKQKLDEGSYSNVEQFTKDVDLVWDNAMTYNRSDSDIYACAEKHKKMFHKKMESLLKGEGKKASKKSTPADKEATKQDRIKFSQLVNQLNSDELEKLVLKIRQECPQALTQEIDLEIEIEINNIDPTTLSDLNTFCNTCIEKKKGKAS
eukprot:CAMPEP_0175141842 /NCGR_PEP_ID=MMETSP0087-20121206/12379_1 /TAXON_ID=136419 /ORGANISM="Unknown Unknown, Strain D1" /LENGTH=206 /DNA_ID=CAMNT_0016425401 /DNA_START=58 /DNA_END=678 /DNA_ORIENTATION=-